MNDHKINIDNLRDVCHRAALLMNYIAPLVVAGVTTEQLNQLCEDYTRDVLDSESAPLNYHGFPKSICTSINGTVCHGIPSDRALTDGDIINVDVTLKRLYDGVYYYGDMSRMFAIGQVKPQHQRLCDTAKLCLDEAIKVVAPGVPFRKIGEVIQRIADTEGFSVVRDFCGHGIGTEFHCAPQILHYANDISGTMKEGMVFTIEPMINERGYRVKVLEDSWTAVTVDGGYSAQWEHTILVTATGAEVLTK